MLRDGTLSLTPTIASTLLELVDHVRVMLREIESTGREGKDEHGDLHARLVSLRQPDAAASEPRTPRHPTIPPPPTKVVTPVPPALTELSAEMAPSIKRVKSVPPAAPVAARIARASKHPEPQQISPRSEPPAEARKAVSAPLAAKANNKHALSLVRHLRASSRAKDSYVVVLETDVPEEQLVQLYDAGVDAMVRAPCGATLLAAAVKAAERCVPKAADDGHGGAHDRIAPAGSRSMPANSPGGREPLEITARSLAWRSAATTVLAGASQFLTLPVAHADVAVSKRPLAHAKQILLVSAKDQLEIRIALGCDAVSASALVTHLFGDEGEDMTSDMLGELGNIFMGVLKTALGAEALSYTGGLPMTVEPGELLRPHATYKHQEAFALVAADATVLVHLGLRSKSNVFVEPTKLSEGMVVAKDVFTPRGLLLLSAGTRLSKSMIDKIQQVLPPRLPVEVMAP